MIRTGASADGNLFLDYGVPGNLLSRPGLDALLRRAAADPALSHLFAPNRKRVARPGGPIDGVRLENRFRRLGVTPVFTNRVLPPLGPGRGEIGKLITSLVEYDQAGKERRELAEKMLFAQLVQAKSGFSTGGRPPYGFRWWLATAAGEGVRPLADGRWSRWPATTSSGCRAGTRPGGRSSPASWTSCRPP